LPLLSQYYSTPLPSAERYDKRHDDRFVSGEVPNLRRFTY
jgi:hypothetical protein